MSVGGTVSREKVGAAINRSNGLMYVAVASNTNDDGNGNHLIGLYTNSDASSNLSFVGNVTLQYSNGTALGYTPLSPALAFQASEGELYIAFTYNYGVIVAKQIGSSSTFSYVTQLSTSYSGPGLAYDPIHQRMYVSFIDGDRTISCCNNLDLYSVDPNSNITSYAQYPQVDLAFDPGMVVYQGTLYISAQNYDTHKLSLFTTTDGVSVGETDTSAGDTTSTTPSLAVHNNLLYLGFRTNDGDHKFLYKYTSDGSNWTTVDPNYAMGGPPTLVSDDPGATVQYVPSLTGQLFNAFAADQGGRPFTLAHTY